MGDPRSGVARRGWALNVFLLTKAKAKALKTKSEKPTIPEVKPEIVSQPEVVSTEETEGEKLPDTSPKSKTLRLAGSVPSELWNRLATKLLPSLRSGDDLKIGIEFTVTVKAEVVQGLEADLRQALEDLGIQDRIKIEKL